MVYFVREKAGYIISQICGIIQGAFRKGYRQEKTKVYSLVTILEKFVRGNQRETAHEGYKLITMGSDWVLSIMEDAWGDSRKGDATLMHLVQLICLALQLTDVDQFERGSEKLMRVLFLLKQPQRIDISDQLLKLLYLMLQKFNYIEPQLCEVLASLGRIVNYNNGNLNEICDVLRALNSEKIVGHIIYEYS